jgi:heme exporter protein B
VLLLVQIWAVLKKDFRLEIRSRLGFNSVLAFIFASTLISIFIVGVDALSQEQASVMYWIIILFASITAMNRAFILETDRSTLEFIQLHSSPLGVYLGKLLFNICFTFAISFITALIIHFLVGFGNPNLGHAIIVLLLGSIGLSGAATLLSAIAAMADRKATLFPVIALPVMAPLMILLASASKIVILNLSWTLLANDILSLFGFAGVMISASIMLFEYLWD